MAVSTKWYGPAFLSAFNKEIDLDADSMKIMLCDSTYAPNQDTHRYQSQVTGEVVGSGYIAGGKALTGATVAYDGATNVFKFDENDVAWDPSTITARFAVIYDATPGNPALNPLLVYIDFGADVSSVGAAFTVSFNAAGVATVTAA